MISAKLSVYVIGADMSRKTYASSISELASSSSEPASSSSELCQVQRPLLSSTPLKMSGPSDHLFDLNLGEEASMPSPDNIWRSSFISPIGPLTVRDSVIKNDMTAAVVARNFVTPKDNRLLSKRSDELDVKDSLAFSAVCRAVPCNGAPNDQPSMPPPSGAPSTADAPSTTETSPKQPL
ncbi:unnamed protein product [Malus baccata var. baccata]